MKTRDLEQLIKRHTIAQEKANSLYNQIINELDNRGLLDSLDRTCCMGRINLKIS